MAKLSTFGTSVYGPDESVVGTIGNVAEMWNPEKQAKGQLAQAHADYYKQIGAHAQASAELELAKAKAAKDQNDAYNVDALVKNGMTPLQAQMYVSARGHYLDATKGYNTAVGGNMLTSGQGDPNSAAALLGLNPTINSAYTVGQGNDIRNQNSANKIADTIAAGTIRNRGLESRGTVIPAGGMFIPGAGQVQPSVLNVPEGKVPPGAIVNPKPDNGMSPTKVNALDSRMRNGMTVLSDIVAGSGHGKDNSLNPGDANAIVTAATTKYPNLPAHQAIPRLIQDQNVQFNEKPSDWYNPVSWFGHNAIVPTAGDKPVQEGLADIIAPTGTDNSGPVAPAAPAVAPAGPMKVSNKAEYDALPSGTQYLHPDGTIKIKK